MYFRSVFIFFNQQHTLIVAHLTQVKSTACFFPNQYAACVVLLVRDTTAYITSMPPYAVVTLVLVVTRPESSLIYKIEATKYAS